jgi:two-component system chemotaxis sensor kinase CheA
VSLTLPLTLTIVNALLVRGGTHLYAVPLADVDNTLTILPTEIHRGPDGDTSPWEGQEIPVRSLEGLLGQGRPRGEEYAAAVLGNGDRHVLLIVDELIEEREVVIKPIDDLLNTHRLFSGVSVLEDGRLVFILDTSAVLRENSSEGEAWAPRS